MRLIREYFKEEAQVYIPADFGLSVPADIRMIKCTVERSKFECDSIGLGEKLLVLRCDKFPARFKTFRNLYNIPYLGCDSLIFEIGPLSSMTAMRYSILSLSCLLACMLSGWRFGQVT